MSLIDLTSAEAELHVLGGMIVSRETIEEVRASVRPGDFAFPKHRAVFVAICNCADLLPPGKPLQMLLLREELRTSGRLDAVGGDDFLVGLTRYKPSFEEAAAYAKFLIDLSEQRAMVASGEKLKDLASKEITSEEKFSAARRLIEKIGERSDNAKPKTMAILGRECLDEIEEVRIAGRPKAGTGSGFQDLDRFTGGFNPGTLVMLAGRPGSAKSSLVMEIGVNIAQTRKRVLFFSLEMSGGELFRRAVSGRIGLPANFTQSQVPEGATYTMMVEAIEELGSIPLSIDERPTIQIGTLRAIAAREHRKSPLSLVAVDYIQLVQPDRHTENRAQDIADIAMGLKRLAKELEVPVIALSQLSRNVENRANKRPVLSDLRDSGGLEAAADQVIMLYRDEYYNPPAIGPREDPQHVEPIELIFTKNRNGATGTVTMGFQAAFTHFRDYDERRTLPFEPPKDLQDRFSMWEEAFPD